MMEKLSLNENSTLLVNKLGLCNEDHKQQLKLLNMKRQQSNNMQNDDIEIKEEDDQASTGVSKKQWTMQEDDLVFKLHNQYGNKWAIIAERLKGRTDNCIKNHFYSRLRKGLRKINKLIEDQYKQSYKEFKIIDLYKVIEASDEKFKQINSSPSEMTDIGHDLKNRIFIYAEQESDGTQQFAVKSKKLLDDLNDFAKNYKRKSKKCRRYSPMGVGSVYRNNSKKPSQIIETEEIMQQQNQQQQQKNTKLIQQKEEVKVQPQVQVKVQPQIESKDKRLRQRRQKPKNSQTSKQLTLVSVTKQITPLQIPQQLVTIRTRKGNTYRKFSDDQGEQKDDVQQQREQRLNHFAQNILKTFKSYYSFKSFKSNSAMEQPFFQ